jgi:catechol 2,3-dioxygenase-like lactoylglutathione lyase family enzyme
MLGVFLLSFNCDVDAVIGRLGVAVEGRIEMPAPNGPVVMATVRDPDGILIELIGI